MKPLFSIIIPTFNRAEQLRRAIESVERQSFRDFEVLVCDDGSIDHTRDVVASFQERLTITYQRAENWGGPARPRNNGLRAARGEWICFLDADDWWYPEKLERVHENLSPADVVHHDGDIYTKAGKKHVVKMRSRTLTPPVFSDLMTKGNALITSGICVRKDVIDKAGGFLEDKALISVEDYDLWLRIALITDRFVHVPLSLCGYFEGEGNISGTPRHISALAALFDRFKDRLQPEDRRESEKYFSYCMGLAMLKTGMYDKSRGQFIRSAKSRNAHIAAMSLIRIITSFLRQWSAHKRRRD
jgi:glycosyltransferase involved in cell wall biosynthesis